MTNRELIEIARRQGQKRFTSLTPCKWGHSSLERFVSNNSCCECASKTNQTEEVKLYKSAWAKEHNKKSETKEKQNNRRTAIKNNPILLGRDREQKRIAEGRRKENPAYVERRAAYLKEYHSRPEVHERVLEWRRLPENREKAHAGYREYMKTPEAKALRKASAAEYRRENRDRILAQTRTRQATKLFRTPSWANLDKIADFYSQARKLTELTGILHHVDHIIPLQGEVVSGFHVETNLRVVPAKVNLSKHNKFDESLL